MEHEESIFRNTEPLIEKPSPDKKALPKPTFEKRAKQDSKDHIFYGVLLLMGLISFILQVVNFHLGGILASLLAIGATYFCYQYTHPERWKEPNVNIEFWNVSVTLSVWAKCLHPKIFEWNQILLWVFFSGIAFGFLVSPRMLAWCFGLYLLVGLLFVAERNMTTYATLTFALAWMGLIAMLTTFLLIHVFSLGTCLVVLTLYQTYQRFSGLEIEYPMD